MHKPWTIIEAKSKLSITVPLFLGVDSEKPKLEELGLAIGPKYSNNNKINIIK